MATTLAPHELDTDQALALVDQLGAVFATGRTKSLDWRRAQLNGLIRLLQDHEQELAAALSTDLGKPAMNCFLGEISPPLAEARHALKNLTAWTKKSAAAVPMSFAPAKAWTQPEPKGVVLVVAPWNFPVLLCLAPLANALAAGNAVVIKPSEMAPAVSATLARLLPRYVDPEAVAIVEGGVATTTALLEARFDHILYTGSGRIGRIVLAAAAKHLTPVTLELGGKSPAIVTAEADVKVAARRLAWAKVTAAGQACVAPDYVLVESSVRAAFIEALVNETSAADRFGETTRIIDQRNTARLTGLLDGHGGIEAVSGGPRDNGTFAPVVIVDPDPSSKVMQEEIFGPILPVVEVESLHAAIDFINRREKPLALYLFSSSAAEEQTVLEQTSSGSVGLNHIYYQTMLPELPFGGIGESGMGAYHGKVGFETFSHRKAVLRKPASFDPSFAYPPFSSVMQRMMRWMAR
ncbi:aldehyde dehydrogenase [Mycolicibacterium parafortuitum]|uniref:Aldehyde dehydrogenase n=1 Tax=Mycolicibacterium parafortuitum TaxID=39692 RepID=A0A7I7TXA9_MYCPF|nr:aldehyde dehydrogenase family protein [Mycolicibacterium parafortuitum]BBY73195.1 aldehyde dehydrogenase [Mycolicibacterium parafortuitum]